MWDETLYSDSAAYYPHGRMAYPPELPSALREELSLDGRGRLLDVGCGPGSLTLLLAPSARSGWRRWRSRSTGWAGSASRVCCRP